MLSATKTTTGSARRFAQILLPIRAVDLVREYLVLPMVSREERLAANELLFRHVNERILELSNRWDEQLSLVCECSNADCAQPIALSVAEYEQLRSDPLQFIVAPGHELMEIEDVIYRRDGYLVVRKHPDVLEQVG